MTTINDLKAAVANRPQLLAMVNALETDNQRLDKLIFDLARLDEALMQRIHTLASTQYNDPIATAMMANFVDLLTTVSSFINTAVSAPPPQLTLMTTIDDLKAAVADRPQLLAMVNALETDHYRLDKLIFDLARLDEALMQKVHTLANFIDLLTTVSSFINMAMSVPDDRAATAATIYNDLMKRIKEEQ